MPPGVQMGRILHIKSSVHTHPHRYKPTWQKVNRCSFCLCYRKKLCIVFLIHKLNLENMKSVYGAHRPMANTDVYGRNIFKTVLISGYEQNFVCFSVFCFTSYSWVFFSVINSKGWSLETVSRIYLLIVFQNCFLLECKRPPKLWF